MVIFTIGDEMISWMSGTQRVLIGTATIVAVVVMGIGANAALNDSASDAAIVVSAPAADAIPIAADVAVALSTEGISASEAAGLVFMREEEKLARDVYLTFADMWGSRIFSNIAEAEQTHMDAVLGLIETHGLEDPVGDNAIGVFIDPSLQQMYDDLVESGSVSAEAALEVGALIEEVDIEDLAVYLGSTVRDDIEQVYERLLSGSENHLRAFVSRLDTAGVGYEPSVLDVETYNAILASANERGGHGEDGGAGRWAQQGRNTREEPLTGS
jgi:hypothetical protein